MRFLLLLRYFRRQILGTTQGVKGLREGLVGIVHLHLPGKGEKLLVILIREGVYGLCELFVRKAEVERGEVNGGIGHFAKLNLQRIRGRANALGLNAFMSMM